MEPANLREYNGYVKAIKKELGEEPIPVENEDEANLIKFPPELLAKVFSLVGSKDFNPAPPNFVKYIDAKGARDFRKKCENNMGHRTYNGIDNQAQWDYIEERDAWTEKVKEEYPIRNLMLLRRVCTKFESVINNEMTPGKDFDFLMIDVRLQGHLDASRQVTFFKYGGNGSLNPAIRLVRVRRFNEVDYEHIQKFERIRDLHISDMMLTEELFETILRLDLTSARRITFERIVGVKFDESINVVNYIQAFLETLNTPANVYFNSEMFDPNVVLFGLKDEDEVEPVTDETVLLDMKVIEIVNEKRTSGRRKYRNKVKIYRKPEESDFQFRRFKLIKIINTILFNEPHAKMFKLKELSYKSRRAFHTLKKTMMDTLKYKLRRRSDSVKKAGEWHLQQAIGILDRKKNGRDSKSAMFHLKILKQIVESDKMSEKEEESIVHTMQEAQDYNELMGEFEFISKFQMKSRIYCPRSENH
ncbi:hypothetical protein CAEBREN_17709 [Caenorhabditis brenneri]|uniref:Uncharacterized protein n=1 Tax=Caenorhabditis brenneri TaxID=135651 RepID=G0PAK1_CAEBE|nr:hypothetical protein CAEBREN_17709 [Caenorhabditis brenneri]